MPIFHCTVELAHKNGLPEDSVVNTFNFITLDTTVATADVITANLNDFYNADIPGAGTGSLATYLANSLSRTFPPLVRFYEPRFDGGPMGSPVYTRNLSNLTAATPGGSSLPAEVALCLSYHSNYGFAQEELGNTRPRARLRGRVFLGPWLQGVSQEGTNGITHPTTNIINVILDAGKALMAMTPIQWAVWSRVDNLATEVTQCSVDDAFDTQRRRGQRPISKTIAAGTLVAGQLPVSEPVRH